MAATLARIGEEGGRLAAGAHEDLRSRSRQLLEGHVHRRPGLPGEAVLAHVGNDPDHRPPSRPLRHVEGDAPAHRAAVGPPLAGQLAVDDRHLGRLRIVLAGEAPPFEQRHAQGPQVVFARHMELRPRRRLTRRRGLPLDAVGGRQHVRPLQRHVAGNRRGDHRRIGGELLQQRLIEAGDLGAAGVLGERQVDHRGQHPLRAEAGIDGDQPHQAAHHQAGADEQDQRHRHLRRHHQVAEAPLGGGGRRATGSLPQSGRQVVTQGLHDGQPARGQPGGERDREREEQDQAVDADLVGARREAVGKGHEDAEAEVRQQASQHAAQQRRQHALGQQLPHQLGAAGAERGAHHHFLLPAQQPGEGEVGGVGAGQQQHQADGAEEDPERRPETAHQLLAHRHHRHRHAGDRRGRVLALQAGVDGADVCLRLANGDPRLQLAEEAHHAKGAAGDGRLRGAERTRRGGHEDARLVGILGQRRQHADDQDRFVVHAQPPADDARIAAEAVAPVVIGQQQHRIGAVALVVGSEVAPEDRFDTESAEEVGRRHAGRHPVRLPLADQVEGHRVVFHDRRQGLALGAVVAHLRHREVDVDLGLAAGARQQPHQRGAVAVGQRAQQHAAGDAEDRRVGADAQGQGQDGDQRVAGMGRELAAGQLEILQHVHLSLPRRTAAGGSGPRPHLGPKPRPAVPRRSACGAPRAPNGPGKPYRSCATAPSPRRRGGSPSPGCRTGSG